MIPTPTDANEEIKAAVAAGKNLVVHLSANTRISITSTDALEVQQVLAAIEPVEQSDAPGHILHEAFPALLEAAQAAPVETKQFLQMMIGMIDE